MPGRGCRHLPGASGTLIANGGWICLVVTLSAESALAHGKPATKGTPGDPELCRGKAPGTDDLGSFFRTLGDSSIVTPAASPCSDGGLGFRDEGFRHIHVAR
jgi:hypothetical protein